MPDPSSPDEPRAIRTAYEEEGVDGYYRQHGAEYRNPNEEGVQAGIAMAWGWGIDTTRVLDLGCGSGEATLAMWALGGTKIEVVGCDPYTGVAFHARTGLACRPWSFAEIANGSLGDEQFSLIIASFSLHLCPESLLPAVLYELKRTSHQLLLLSPHKRPEIRPSSGWGLRQEDYARHERVRVRLYHRVGSGS